MSQETLTVARHRPRGERRPAMTDFARIRLPKIRGPRCLARPLPDAPIDLAPGARVASVYCNRAHGHKRRHAQTKGAARVVVAVWP